MKSQKYINIKYYNTYKHENDKLEPSFTLASNKTNHHKSQSNLGEIHVCYTVNPKGNFSFEMNP